MALATYKALKCQVYSRVDMIVNKEWNSIYIRGKYTSRNDTQVFSLRVQQRQDISYSDF